MLAGELSNVRERRRFTDLVREGISSAKTAKIVRLVNSLKWRHRYQNEDHYSIEMLDKTVITVRQVSNGEILGLGTGVSVWPAAHVLCKYIERRYGVTALRGKRVCDIGTGTGCTGFAAAALGAHVTLTDQAQILPFLECNKSSICEANKQIRPESIDICRYDWGESAAHLGPPFDLILISDCILPKLYPMLPLLEAVAAIMDRNSVAIFSYEHRPYPYFDPRQEFRRLAKELDMCVRIIPLSEHDSFYCLDDVELWEVSFNLLVSEDKSKLPEIAALPREITGDDQVKSGADSPVTTDVTVTSSSSNSFQMDYPTAYPRNTSVEMMSWGPVPVVMARLLDEIVEIRQNPSGEGTGCVLWASSVILSRFILSENFTGRGFSECQISAGKINSEHFRRPRIAVELGAGCGLTSIALLKKGFSVIAADRSSAVPLLRCNISEYVSGRDKLTRNKESVESGPSAINQSGDCHHDKIKESCCNFQVVEFDWQQSFNAHRAGLDCESDGSLSTAPTDQEVVLSALQNFYKLRQLTTTASNLPQEGQSQTVGNYALLQPDYPDLIVCSDCVYATASVEPLLHALSWLAGPETVLLIGNEMRTALDHFISEARQQKDRCTTTASTVQRSPDISIEADIGISEKQTHQAPFSWSFEDAYIDNTEVFGGGYSDNSTSTSTEADFGSEVETIGAAPSDNEQSGQRSKQYSYSEINRPVRILLGRTKTQQ